MLRYCSAAGRDPACTCPPKLVFQIKVVCLSNFPVGPATTHSLPWWTGAFYFPVYIWSPLTMVWLHMLTPYHDVTTYGRPLPWCDRICSPLTMMWPHMLAPYRDVTTYACLLPWCDYIFSPLTMVWLHMLASHYDVTTYAYLLPWCAPPGLILLYLT